MSQPVTENDEIEWRWESFDFFNGELLSKALDFLEYFIKQGANPGA